MEIHTDTEIVNIHHDFRAIVSKHFTINGQIVTNGGFTMVSLGNSK